MVVFRIIGAAVSNNSWWDLSEEQQNEVPRSIVYIKISNNDFFEGVPFDNANKMLNGDDLIDGMNIKVDDACAVVWPGVIARRMQYVDVVATSPRWLVDTY